MSFFLRKQELVEQLEQIKSESEQHLKAQHKEIFERFHIVNSRKALLKKLLNLVIKPKQKNESN